MRRFAWLGIALCFIGCKRADLVGAGVMPPDASVEFAPTMLRIDPADIVINVSDGDMPMIPFSAIATTGSGDKDVSAQARFSIADGLLGSFSKNVLSPIMGRAGQTTVTALYTAPGGTVLSATAHVRIMHYASYGSLCPGCDPLPDPSVAVPCNGAPPVMVYPTDGVLLPPNMNSLSIQWKPGSAGRTFEVDFENATTDVRIVTRCAATVDTQNNMSGGCSLDLTDQMWNSIVEYNKGGDPLTVSVRASSDASCATPSVTGNPNISFAEQDLTGAVYYWKSQIGMVTGGDVWRKNFGDKMPESKITTANGGFGGFTCFGCHALSRDGKRMTVNFDDNDSDDEYGDVTSGLIDLKTLMPLSKIQYGCGQVPGFQTFNHDHRYYLGSLGNAYKDPASVRDPTMACGNSQSIAQADFYLASGDTAQLAANFAIPAITMGSRATQPDWSIDDKSVVYVVPQKFGNNGFGGQSADDTHLYGGSLYQMPYLGMGKFGTPKALVSSTGDNNYYPSYSPDGKFVLYDHVPLDKTLGAIDACMPGSCPNDSFSNPKARAVLLPLIAGATPIDLERLNGSPRANAVSVSNSWPRWSPFVQKYKGSLLLWVTFSSTRDYGLRVRNHQMVNGAPMKQCYPSATPENTGFMPFGSNCQSPQLWMAAINLTMAGEFQNGGDPSFPAFWLPFQDVTTHNHTAQWTAPPNMGGPCVPKDGDCSKGGECCQPYTCLGDGTCGMVVM